MTMLSRLGRLISVGCASVGKDYPLFPLAALHRTFSCLNTPIPDTTSEAVHMELQRLMDLNLFLSLMSIYRISGPWNV